MGQPLALVVESGRPSLGEAIKQAEQAGLRIVDMRSTEEALDFFWDQGSEVDLLLTDLTSLSELSNLRMLVDDWANLEVLVVSEHVDPPRDLPNRIKFIPAPTPQA